MSRLITVGGPDSKGQKYVIGSDEVLADGAANYTSTDIGQVSAADKIYDFGADTSNRPTSVIVTGLIDSSDDADGDETYVIAVYFSETDATGAAFDYKVEYNLTRGDAGFFELLCQVNARYMSIHFILGGTTPILAVNEAGFTAARI